MAGDAVICQQGILGEAADSQGGPDLPRDGEL